MIGISKIPAKKRPKKIRFIRFIIFSSVAPQKLNPEALNGTEVTQATGTSGAKFLYVRFSDQSWNRR